MENKQMLEEFLELVQIPVQSRSERQIADVLKAKLEALGLEVVEEDTGAKIGGNAGNIRAVLRGTADCEPLLFSAHMDRVANNGAIKPIVDEEKGIVHTDGSTILASDDVAGICIILDALRRLKASDRPHGDIEVAFSVCEEFGILGGRYFEFDKSELNSEGKTVVKKISTELNKNDVVGVLNIEGHTDSKGTKEYNQNLSEKRAKSTENEFKKNITNSKIQYEVKGYGEERPIADNNTEEGRAQNRRVEILIIPKATYIQKDWGATGSMEQ